jgi:hypothetical protein
MRILNAVDDRLGSVASDRYAAGSHGMSASPPIASELWHRSEMTRRAKSRHSHRSKTERLVDHLISAYQKRFADVEPDSLGSFEIDHQLELWGGLNGQLTWFLAPKDAISID